MAIATANYAHVLILASGVTWIHHLFSHSAMASANFRTTTGQYLSTKAVWCYNSRSTPLEQLAQASAIVLLKGPHPEKARPALLLPSRQHVYPGKVHLAFHKLSAV